MVLASALFAGVYLFQRNKTIHAAPVSSAHSTFGNRCELCHDQPGQTARRLVALSDDFHSVSNDACQACHHAADHANGMVAVDVGDDGAASACVDCHQEHRPDQALTDVMDRNCTECHRQLELEDGTAVSFFAAIEQFEAGNAAHPEFAVLRSDANEVGPRHRARNVAVFEAAPTGGGRWIDRGGLKLNHHVHMNPAGVMHPDGKERPLDCSACHVPESSGAYMQPIQYEPHCNAATSCDWRAS